MPSSVTCVEAESATQSSRAHEGISFPAPTKSQNPRIAYEESQDAIELQGRTLRNDGSNTAGSDDIERRSSLPGFGRANDVVEIVPSLWEPYMNRFRVPASCMANFVGGLCDSAAGAVIPYMETYYNIGYAVVSLIFVGQALGFVFSAVFMESLRAKFGRAKLLGFGQFLMILGFVPIVATAPFPVIAISFFLVGFGEAINVAIGNVFCGSLQNGTLFLGLIHGAYGLGGITGPLAATALVTTAGAVWSRYYTITLGLVAICMVFSLWAFRHFEKEQSPHARPAETEDLSAALGMLAAVRTRVVLLGSLFIFAYQGAEVSISGWVISFLISARGGDPSTVGYVTAGFWAGITIGRLTLSALGPRIGEKLFVYGLTAGAIAFQILVWAVPDVVTNAVAVSIVGLMLGPVYPCAAAVFIRNMSKSEAVSGVSTISACGSLGGAAAPFVTGLLAQVVGTWVLHPIAIFLFVVMLLCWWGISSEDKRSE